MITICNENRPAYSVTPCKQIDTDGAPHSAYGISYLSGGILTTVEDVSCNGDMVNKMAEVFTLCGVPYNRLWEAIDALIS